MGKITVGIPSRDRPHALARLLASLHAQTFKHFDVIIVNDSSGPLLDKAGELMLEALMVDGHKVEILEGVRINQAYAHNAVLWHPEAHEWILRIDDDMILQPDYIEMLVQGIEHLKDLKHDVGAVSGTILTEHVHKRGTPIDSQFHGGTRVGVRGDELRAITFMQEYDPAEPIACEHLYSSYLYNRDAMQQVGGFPLVYTRGVSYHEETDASYRLFLNNKELFLLPTAMAIHSHEGGGGTRLMSPSQHAARREEDWDRFQKRLGLLRGLTRRFRPTVAICSQHTQGIGGGQRLTYTMLDALQGQDWLKCVHLYPLLTEVVESPEYIAENYGVEPDLENRNAPEYYDIVISIGHVVPKNDELPVRRLHIHYSLFPTDIDVPRNVDRVVSISEFTALGVNENLSRNGDVIYPYVDMAVDPDNVIKERMILLVGRSYISKSLRQLAMAFVEMELPEDTSLHIVVPEASEEDEFLYLSRLAEQHDSIIMHVGISVNELDELFRRAAVLWAGRGYGAPPNAERDIFEHFGYTPVEALAHYCVPLAFDAGGYCETTLVRWEKIGELEKITKSLLEDKGAWTQALSDNLGIMGRFSRLQFVKEWKRIILMTNAYTWEQDIEWRKSDPIELKVISSDYHVAFLGDHPHRFTGYGIIADQVCKYLTKHDMNVHVLGINGIWPDVDREFASLWPVPENHDSSRVASTFLKSRDYDAIVVAYDPFISERMISRAKITRRHMPIIGFVSQEGKPAHSAWDSILSKCRFALTYSKSASDAVFERYGHRIDWAHLGVDHAPFERYSDDDRNIMRRILGWEDRFVIMYVGRNVRNKNLALLMKTTQMLRGLDHDALLLLHTNPIPKEEFHGINVNMYADILGLVSDKERYRHVVISTAPVGRQIPYERQLDKMLKEKTPRTENEIHNWFMGLGMIDRYNVADLYLDMASAEGFGLPTFEAMACGVPVISVDDDYVRREVIGDHASLLPAKPHDVWITGADLMMARPLDAVTHINEMILVPGNRFSSIHPEDAGPILEKLKWDNVGELILEKIKAALN